MEDAGFFVFAGGFVKAIVEGLVGPMSQRFIDLVSGFAVSGLALYIVLFAISVMFGLVQGPLTKAVITVLKVSFIFGIALSSANYNAVIIDGFTDFQDGMIAAVGGGSSDIYELLDASFSQGMSLVMQCLEEADNASWLGGGWVGWWAAAVLIMIATLLVVLVGGSGILAAVMFIAILFSIGPLFIFALAFPWTAKFFSAFISEVINFTMIIILLSIVVTLSLVGFDSFILDANMSGDGDINPFLASCQILGFACLIAFIAYQAYGRAATLSGGLSMQALTLAHAMTPARLLNNTLNPKSTRMDATTGKPTTQRQMIHMATGNNVLAKKYRIQQQQRFGRNFKSAGGSAQNTNK